MSTGSLKCMKPQTAWHFSGAAVTRLHMKLITQTDCWGIAYLISWVAYKWKSHCSYTLTQISMLKWRVTYERYTNELFVLGFLAIHETLSPNGIHMEARFSISCISVSFAFPRCRLPFEAIPAWHFTNMRYTLSSTSINTFFYKIFLSHRQLYFHEYQWNVRPMTGQLWMSRTTASYCSCDTGPWVPSHGSSRNYFTLQDSCLGPSLSTPCMSTPLQFIR